MATILHAEERPWGKFKELARTKDYVVKELLISPFCQTSYQSHEHRQELWLPISGHGTAIIDDVEFPLIGGINLPIMVHFGQKHRILNADAEEDLIIVEVWTGGELRENDITRYEDDYGRV